MVGGWFARTGGRSTNRDKLNIRFFRYDTLQIATNNFSTLLGRGGYGSVFKGVLPDDGTTVAIKIFKKPYDGFLEMVELMSHIRHKNLIQVIGCCVANNNHQQLLVCEFAENGSVWDCLYGMNTPSFFDWKRRASVCIGTARGLSYLHDEIDPRIIHRDIKPSNILLDANFVPKIVDFDLIYFADGGGCVYAEGEKQTAVERAEFAHTGVEYFSTYTTDVAKGTLGYLDPSYMFTGTTIAKGTLGYLDPSYMSRGQLTEKVDVYSFGVVMLEIIAGRRPIDFSHLESDEQRILDWVTRLKKDGMVLEIVDPKLTDFPKEDVERFINVALLCTRAASEQRPSMFEVVHMLYGRYKSDLEISDMAASAITDHPAQWKLSAYGIHTPEVSMYNSFTTSLAVRDGSSPIGTDYAADTKLREEPDEIVRGYSSTGSSPIGTDYAANTEVREEPDKTVRGYSSTGSSPIGTDYAADTELREEPDETVRGNSDSFIVLNHSEGESSASAAALAPTETSLASEEERSCPEDVVRAYYDRSMEKIMRYQVAKRRNISDRTTVKTQTTVVKKSSGNRFSEAVYPPFLSGEYRSARVLYSGWPAPL